jgi:hypothetical protein
MLIYGISTKNLYCKGCGVPKLLSSNQSVDLEDTAFRAINGGMHAL